MFLRTCILIRKFTQMAGRPLQSSVVIAEHQPSALQIAVQAISSGKVIALATDTIYGLASSSSDPDAVNELYRIKTRNPLKPLAICIADICDLDNLCNVTISIDLLNQLLPGPVTLIFERSLNLHSHFNPDTNLVGVRIPDHDFIRSVARLCGPLALTSANVSTHESSLKVEEFKELWPHLAAVFDSGSLCQEHSVNKSNLKLRSGSTVVDLSQKGYFKIIREGCAIEATVKTLVRHSLVRLL